MQSAPNGCKIGYYTATGKQIHSTRETRVETQKCHSDNALSSGNQHESHAIENDYICVYYGILTSYIMQRARVPLVLATVE